jgi:hypothetical protein
MGKAGYYSCTDEEFIAAWRELQSPTEVANRFGIGFRRAQARRKHLEQKYGVTLPVFRTGVVEVTDNKAVVRYEISDGVVLVGSDAHIWPGPLTTMQRAFLRFAERIKPAAIVANGDFFDGARMSRHPSIGWEQKPGVWQELEAVKDYLGELERIAPASRRFWPAGNHDLRFESKIANSIPEMERVKGAHLKDHFPNWLPCWRVDVNDDVVIRHRELGGEHADFRNVVTSGKTIVTGHDHRANVTAYRNYTGTRWGVRCGYMADSPQDSQFVHYLEGREVNWQPAFVVMTWKGGRLLWPELCVKHDDTHVEFRGEVIEV